jgi:hypothetical protein
MDLETMARRIQQLEQRILEIEQRGSIIEKAYRVMGVHTHYVEFGAYTGGSLISAYWAAHKVFQELTGGHWDHSFQDPGSVAEEVRRNWERMRFFAFDSFAGMPATAGPDKEVEIFKEGTYACTEQAFRENLGRYGVPAEKVVTVPGFFAETCTPENAERYGIGNVGIVHIDSDLYESARTALEFITPYLNSNAVLIFDEWYQYFGHPEFGEQRAFAEWRERHPEWLVTEFQKEGAFRMAFILSKR